MEYKFGFGTVKVIKLKDAVPAGWRLLTKQEAIEHNEALIDKLTGNGIWALEGGAKLSGEQYDG